MNTNKIIVLIVIAVVLGAGAWFGFQNKQEAPSSKNAADSLRRVLTRQDYGALRNMLADQVLYAKEASGCCGIKTKDEIFTIIQDLLGEAAYDFSENNENAKKVAEYYRQYVESCKNAVVGISNQDTSLALCVVDTKVAGVRESGTLREFGIQNVSADTRGWKTYRNERYGFELTYPTYLEFREGQPAGIPTVKFNNPRAGKTVVFSVSIFSDSAQLEDSYSTNPKIQGSWQDQGETMIDNKQARKLFRSAVPGDIETDMTAYLIPSRNISITFNSGNFHQISVIDLDSILSTFKFIK